MISGIYAIISPSGKCYIGSAQNIPKRWREHRSGLKSGRHHSLPLQRAWEKHGPDAMRFVHILSCAGDELFHYEQMILDGLKPLYNVNPSACGTRGIKWSEESRKRILGRIVSAETRKKIAESLSGRKASPELRDKLSAAHKGVPWSAARAAIKQSPETIAKRAASMRGRVVSEETRKKLAAQAGWKHTEEAKRKMSEAARGRTPWNKGKKVSK